jgi:transcriptional regulator with XRE-family HTH domain
MPRRLSRTDDEETAAYQVAFLRGERGLTQQQIASVLHINQTAVSRLLQRAREIGVLQTYERFVRTPNVDEKKLQALERLLKYSDLEEALRRLPTDTGRQLRRLRDFESASDDDSFAGIERRQRTLGEVAARYVADRLRHAATIGVSWGSTLSRLIDGIRRIGYAWPKPTAARGFRQIVPVAAEPVNYADNSYTSSTLARRLDTIVNGELPPRAERPPEGDGPSRRLALTGVPAFVPTDPEPFVPVLECM